jgi:hypothetical protein
LRSLQELISDTRGNDEVPIAFMQCCIVIATGLVHKLFELLLKAMVVVAPD